MRTKNYIMLSFLIILLNSCYKKCPEFNKKYLSWLPYNIGNELIFVNQQLDTLYLTITTKSVSEEYEARRSCKNKCCGSDATIIANDEYDDNYRKNALKLEIVFTYVENWIHCDIYLGKYNNHKGIAGLTNFENYVDTMTINGFFFNEVVVLERDTIQFTDEIWKVIVANNYGIVKFYDRKSRDEWILLH